MMVSYVDAAWKINTNIEPITLPFVHERAFLHLQRLRWFIESSRRRIEWNVAGDVAERIVFPVM